MKAQELVPLRIVLRNFLNHIESLESQNCPEKSYEAEFQDLKIFSENVKTLKEYSCLEGEKEVNRKKNRYKDILPFDISRVVLSEYAGIPGSDYINANYIKGASGSLAYIASQGPLPSTVNDFWRMVVECEVQVIVMACNEEEAGKAKCEKYWVDEGEERQFGMINVKLLKASTVCPDFSVRTMRLKYTNNNKETEERTVCQLHYVAWPDHGVPTVVQPLLDMVRLVRDTQASETLPVLVHCSAGCGRTGTICAIDYVWGLLRTGKLTSDFSLLHLIREMRKQRIAMVQTKEQYVLVHQAVRELFKEQLSMIDSHPYENVDTNGLLLIKEEDENLYDTIDYVSSHSFDEKFDNKEKETDPPPLPSKKNVTKFSSKYEKEIVNRTAQQRSLNNKSVKTLTQRCSSEAKKITNEKEPSIRNSKNSVNKFSNIEVKKPIPAKGILCVPQLESVPKCKANVKRSKSLKVVRQCEKTTLSVPCYSPESKRRSSLESNFDEQHLIGNIPESYNVRRAVEPVLEERKKGISHLVSKYEILKNSERQTFVRSLTCVDIRPKTVFSHTNSIVSSLEESLAKHKVKLMRSNSQINVLKKSSSTYYKPNTDDTPLWATRDSTKTKMNASQSIYTSLGKVSHEKVTTEDKSKNSSKIGKKPMEGHSFALKAGLFRYPVEKDNLVKHSERIQNPVFSRLEATKVSEDIYKSTNRCKFELDNQFSLDGSLGNYSPNTDRSKRSHDADDLLSTPKMYNSGSCSDNSEQSSHSSVDSKIVNRLDHLKLFNGSKRHPSALNHIQSSQHYEDYSRTIGPNPGDLGNIRGFIKDLSPKRDVDFTQLYTVEKHSDSKSPSISRHENVRIPAQHVKPSNNFRGVDIRPSNRGYNLMNGDIEEVQRPDKNKFSQATISSSNVPSSREYSHQPTDVNYALQNRKNVHHYNGYIHSSQNIPKMGYPSSPHSNQISENSNSSRTTHVTYYSPETPSTFKNSYFHSAPGVDLDRVAASITKNDESLMKATLEELQVRQSKLQMTPKEKNSTKGVPSCSSSSDKKKQQHYL